ncbi:MAG: hypothetical protein ACWGQW_23265 [bacterium]
MKTISKVITILSIILWLILIGEIILLEDYGREATWGWWFGIAVLSVVAIYLRSIGEDDAD